MPVLFTILYSLPHPPLLIFIVKIQEFSDNGFRFYLSLIPKVLHYLHFKWNPLFQLGFSCFTPFWSSINRTDNEHKRLPTRTFLIISSFPRLQVLRFCCLILCQSRFTPTRKFHYHFVQLILILFNHILYFLGSTNFLASWINFFFF